MSQPTGSPQVGSLFKWETLHEIGPFILTYRPPVPGKILEVELICGRKIHAWRGNDGRSYFCHGLTFGGKVAPGGPISPFSGPDVDTIVQNHFRPVIPESAARPGDVLLWRAPDGDTPHSAVLLVPVVAPGPAALDYASTLLTKNGNEPETVMSLERLIVDYYGESYNVFRRQ